MEITILKAEDWEGLYINNNCVLENYKITTEDLIKTLGLDVKIKHVKQEWAEDTGFFPTLLSDIPNDVYK